jgi:hypothetical protein
MMKLAYRVYIATLVLLAFVFAASAQTTDMKNPRSADDPRNTAPTVGTGGPVGGPTGLFTVYDGQVLRRGEYTFSGAISNFDRDPGNVDLTEVPVSFQVGITDNFELFFNTDAYRQVKVNSPGNLSSFYLPNSRVLGISRGAIILAPSGPAAGALEGRAVYRPPTSQPFVPFPYIGGSAGNFGLPFSGPVFGFPANTNALLGPPTAGNNGADNFPGIGSAFGSILPGIVLQTACTTGTTCSPLGTVPTSFTVAPVYLPDAPFINRTFGESSFSTFTVGGKVRFTNVNNPVGFGVVGYYRFYADSASDLSGFNQLQRGSSPGGNRGDFGGAVFLDARVAKWANVSGNVGYNWNSSVKADLPGGTFTLLDRPDELLVSAGIDFPVNRYFQPIFEFRSLTYMAGRTPNAFQNNPIEGIAGFRVYPARWLSLGAAYRYHANEQDEGSFDEDESFNGTAFISCAAVTQPGAPSGNGGPACTPGTVSTNFRGVPPGFTLSQDPHGYILQATIGRRNPRKAAVENKPANVTAISLSDTEITLPCGPGMRSASGGCTDNTTVTVTTTAVDPENDVLTYNYTVSGGRITGTPGATAQWDLSGLQPGSYTITAGVDDGCGLCGQTKTETVRVVACPDCVAPCECGTLSVTGPSGITQPGDSMTFTANVSGGSATDITYNWSVSSGEITSGQGTPSITVATTRAMANTSVTATVEIGGTGMCPECEKTKSETAGVAPNPEFVKIDEFGKLPNDDIRGRLDTFFAELSNNPNNQGYIILYGTEKEMSAREKLITNHINFRNFDRSRITIVRGGVHPDGTVYTKLYRIPPGAENPAP